MDKLHAHLVGGIPNRSMPPGMIIPELVYPDLDAAVAWLCEVLGFKQRLRIGDHRAQLILGEASLIAIGRPPQPGLPPGLDQPQRSALVDHSIMLHVDHVDQLFERAVKSGAVVISPPQDYPFGERQCTVEDVGSHRWTFSQTIADVDPHDWGAKGYIKE